LEDIFADLRKFIQEIEKDPLHDVVAIECSPADYRDLYKATTEVFVSVSNNAMKFEGVRITMSMALIPGFAIGKNSRGEVVGWFGHDGWHRCDEIL
jgi:hypothetical protein